MQAEEARSRDLLPAQRALALATQPLVHALPAENMPAAGREAGVEGGRGRKGVRRRARPQLVAVGWSLSDGGNEGLVVVLVAKNDWAAWSKEVDCC